MQLILAILIEKHLIGGIHVKKRLAKVSAIVMVLSLLIPTVVFTKETQGIVPKVTTYDNGSYRGTFGDQGVQEVGVQFTVENNTLKSLKFKSLVHKDIDYLTLKEGDAQYPILLQNQQVLKYLEGKPVEAIYDLYKPASFVADLDGFTGATVKASKILSAIQDSLNRGVYSPTGEVSRAIGTYEDGRYRGVFFDGAVHQVGVQFDLQNNTIKNLSFRRLFYKDIDYRALKPEDKNYAVLQQNLQVLKYLEGKQLETIFDLYKPVNFVENIDTFTGATVKASKVLSSIRDALNRGAYIPVADPVAVPVRTLGQYKDGRYRGIFSDNGVQQVSIQFELQNNTIKSPSYRHLFFNNVDYRKLLPGDKNNAVLLQNQQLLKYLDGKPLQTIFDLYKPGNFVENVDTFTGATVKANKVLSSIIDGLNRGVYTLPSTATPAPTTPPTSTPKPAPTTPTTIPDTVAAATGETEETPVTPVTPVKTSTPVKTTTSTPAQAPSSTSTSAEALASAPKENLPKTGQLPILAFLVSGLAVTITGVKFLKKA